LYAAFGEHRAGDKISLTLRNRTLKVRAMKKLLVLLLCFSLCGMPASAKGKKKSHSKPAATETAKSDKSKGIPCTDGTVSHAKTRRGACSHHGGIKK